MLAILLRNLLNSLLFKFHLLYPRILLCDSCHMGSPKRMSDPSGVVKGSNWCRLTRTGGGGSHHLRTSLFFRKNDCEKAFITVLFMNKNTQNILNVFCQITRIAVSIFQILAFTHCGNWIMRDEMLLKSFISLRWLDCCCRWSS